MTLTHCDDKSRLKLSMVGSCWSREGFNLCLTAPTTVTFLLYLPAPQRGDYHERNLPKFSELNVTKSNIPMFRFITESLD